MSLLCDKLEFGHGRSRILSNCSFRIPTGSHWVLTGPSGSGKTTLLRLIAGLLPPHAGRVEWDGRVLSEPDRIVVPPHQRSIGMVFQDLGLWPQLTALGHLDLVQSSLPRLERRERSLAMLEACDLASMAQRLPSQLSGGEQQRLALARTLVTRPRLLLLDEPFAALDLPTKAMLFHLLERLRREWSLTLVTVTHQASDVFGLAANHVAVLEGGCLVEIFEPAKLHNQPALSSTRRSWQAWSPKTCTVIA